MCQRARARPSFASGISSVLRILALSLIPIPYSLLLKHQQLLQEPHQRVLPVGGVVDNALAVTSSSRSVMAVDSTWFCALTSSGRTRPASLINCVCCEKVNCRVACTPASRSAARPRTSARQRVVARLELVVLLPFCLVRVPCDSRSSLQTEIPPAHWTDLRAPNSEVSPEFAFEARESS